MPLNRSPRDAVIRAVDLVGVRDIDVLGIVTTYGFEHPDGSCVAAGATYGFPPTTQLDGETVEFPKREIAGTVVLSESGRTCASHPSITVGVRLASGGDPGQIEAVRVTYEHGGGDYELLLPSSLTVETKQ